MGVYIDERALLYVIDVLQLLNDSGASEDTWTNDTNGYTNVVRVRRVEFDYWLADEDGELIDGSRMPAEISVQRTAFGTGELAVAINTGEEN